ncbi:MAG: tetratricopeptide repeat protein [Oceanidesulfovibrio sp.]
MSTIPIPMPSSQSARRADPSRRDFLLLSMVFAALLLGGCSLLEGTAVHLPNLDMMDDFSANLSGEDPADAVDFREQDPVPVPHTPYVGEAEERDLRGLAEADPVIFMFYRGNEHFNVGNYGRALAAYENVLVLEPDHPQAHFRKGACLHMLGEYEEAIQAYNAHLALKPMDARVHYNKGNSLSALGRWQEANESYTRAVKLEPSFANAYANRAFVQLEMGNAAEALEDAATARSLNATLNIPDTFE